MSYMIAPPSPTSSEPQSDIVQSVLNNLGAVFRHLLPGVLIMGAARIAFPCWLWWIHPDSWPNLAFTAVVALTVGNVWFTLNRYVIHQGVDCGMYWLGFKGRPTKSRLGYREDLATFVTESLCLQPIPKSARQHIIFRSSSVLLIYVAAEVVMVFSVWHEPCTIFARHPCWWLGASFLLFGGGVWQHAITRVIDSHIVGEGKSKVGT